MVRTAIQMYTLNGLDQPVWKSVEQVSETTFDGVEFYDDNFDDFSDEQTLQKTQDALAESGLTVTASHIGIERLEAELDTVVEICERLGCSTLVVPTYDPEEFTYREGIEAAADRIAGLAADLAEHDIELLYHNHTFEFDDVDGEVGFELFVEAADGRFGFEPDVGLATHAGYDALSLLDLVADRAPIVHLTDAIPEKEDGLHADIGDGVVDIDACADAAAENGAEWFVCENGVTDDPADSLEHGSDAFERLEDRVTSQ